MDTSNDLDPTTNPDVQEALSLKYSNIAVIVFPLSSGKFAIFDRGYTLRAIMDDTPTAGELKDLSLTFNTQLHYLSRLSAEARFYGEPDDRGFARDLKSQRVVKRPSRGGEIVEIEL